MGRNPVCYKYIATLIPYRSCLKPVDTFRATRRKMLSCMLPCAKRNGTGKA